MTQRKPYHTCQLTVHFDFDMECLDVVLALNSAAQLLKGMGAEFEKMTIDTVNPLYDLPDN